MRLPDAFTLTGIGIGFVLVCVQAVFLAPGEGDIVLNTTHQLRMSSPGSSEAQGNVFMTGTGGDGAGTGGGGCGAALILLAVRWIYKALRKRDGMGLGDVKLLAMIAAFLGFGRVGAGAVCGGGGGECIWHCADGAGKAGGETKLPLGSFLAAGGLFAALFGRGLWIGMWGCCGNRRRGKPTTGILQPAQNDIRRGADTTMPGEWDSNELSR